ncbi:hypothetical protein ACIQNU_39655 [Streptomyces sp. NPDC091292]|uniref:hypothetical protein n=1 Tax=Streptomyces sp. NPDC091292 TaxID=3365991 RepID=UPI003827AF0A
MSTWLPSSPKPDDATSAEPTSAPTDTVHHPGERRESIGAVRLREHVRRDELCKPREDAR